MSWKIQRIFQVPKPQERSRESLPKPPEGMAWLQNAETREWKLVPQQDLDLAESDMTPAVSNHGTTRQADAAEEEEEEEVDFVAPPPATRQQETRRADPFANPFHLPESPTSSSQEESTSSPEVIETATGQQLHGSPKSSTRSSSTGSRSHVLLNMPPPHRDHHHQESKSADDDDEEEADWELLSDRVSLSQTTGLAFVHRTTGSISSHNTSSFSASFQLQRTLSSSTIDSHDLLNLGPSGQGILGVDYVEHVLLPSDTLQGIYLAYKLSASRLKRANHFSGDSLVMAPKRLIIPISKKALRQGYLRVQDTDSKEYKMHALQAEFPKCGLTEAKA